MEKIEQPIALFTKWFEEELQLTNVQIPTAVCLSTIGLDNYPNARFVSFKEILKDLFVITGPLNSRKGIEIKKNNKVALTFWWTETKRQVRIQGIATKITEELANKYFDARNSTSKAVSSICEQGKETDNLELLEKKVFDKVAQNKKIDRPKNWGGFLIEPIRIEFMEFKPTRFHNRKVFVLENDAWTVKQIQP